MSWIKNLQERWGLKSLFQVIIVLMVFSLTGPTVAFLAKPILQFFTGGNELEWWMWLIYIPLSIPVYNIVLLGFGFIFGQFAFFWKYEKKMLKRFGIKIDAEQKEGDTETQ